MYFSLKSLTRKQFYIGLFLFLSVIILFLHARRQGADENHYLGWGHTVFYDTDLFLLNEFEALHMPYFFTPTGYVGELRNFGVALFWLPFYTLSWLFSQVWPNAGSGIDSPIQLLLINWSTFLFIALSVGLSAAMLRQYFSVTVTWLAIATILLGTPLLFYTIQRPISSHPIAIFLASFFLFFWFRKQESSLWGYWGSGIILGWLGMVATFNLVLALIPCWALFANFVVDRNWFKVLKQSVTLIIGMTLGFLPQMLVWQALYGRFTATPYARQLDWLHPHLLEMLFSPFHGLFVYAPILVIAPVGIFLFSRQDKTLAISMGLAWLGLIYIVSSNLAWWAGASFGNRYFLVLSPLFALMIGALLNQSLGWLWVIGPGVVWTVGLWWQTLDGTLKIGEANFYPFTTLLENQTRAWRNLSLVIQTDQHGLLSFPWLIVGGILILSGVVYLLTYLSLPRLLKANDRTIAYFLGLTSLLLVSFTLILWERSENQKTLLAETGFYSKPYRLSTYDPLDLSKSYLDRAKYYQASGQPELVLPDLKAATQAWFSPSRQILNLTKVATPQLTQALDLQYGSEIRWLGYAWESEIPKGGQLVLYWHKLAEETEATYAPLVRLLDTHGETVWEGGPADPFPAQYIPEDYIFYDRLSVDWPLGLSSTAPLWLEVSFPAEGAAATTSTGEPHSGIVRLNNLPSVLGSPDSLTSTDLSKIVEAVPMTSIYKAGDTIELLITWSGAKLPFPASQAEVQFLDTEGHVALREPASLYADGVSPDKLPQPGQPILDTLCLDTPPSLRPGKYQLNLAGPVRNSSSIRTVELTTVDIQDSFQVNQAKTICHQLNSTKTQRKYNSTQQIKSEAVFGGLAILQGYELALQPDADGLQAQLTFHWQSLVNNPPAAQPRLSLVDKKQAVVIAEFTWIPVWGQRPTEYWFKDEIVVDTTQFSLPKLSTGAYNLILEWQNNSDSKLFKTETGQPRVILKDFLIP